MGQLDAQEPKTIVLSSRKKPGDLPTLCPGTNKPETCVLTLSNKGAVEALSFLAVSTGLSALRPPHVTLLREDWADVRRPRLWCGSEKDLGGAEWEGEG